MEGQRKLAASSVLVVGAGGLGSPAAFYLAAAGVGRIGIADDDAVDLSNLQRQILHATADVGRRKTASAKETLAGINPGVAVTTHDVRLDGRNALDILRGYEVVLDATDNFPTRYLLNDACVLLRKPNVYGSIFRFEGQAGVFHPAAGGPCYRCLYPAPPPPGLVPSCAEGGVLGALPGIVGSLQALEAIKLLLGLPGTLTGRLLLFDGLGAGFRELTIRRDPGCPVCGERPTIRELIDYEEFCGLRRGEEGGREGGEISVEDLKARLDRGDRLVLLDVREPGEYDLCNLGGVLIPQNELPRRLGELDRSAEIVVHCKTGARSARAAGTLRAAGFTRVVNLAGGIEAWAERIDRTMPRY